MQKLILFILSLGLIAQSFARSAKYSQECTLVAGKIIQQPGEPVFKFVKSHKYSTDNYLLTHTNFFIRGTDGNEYKIVMDNLFYTWITSTQAITNKDIGITENMRHNYPIGSDVVACGKPFNSDGQRGLHFVHSAACDKTQFSGYLRINGSDVMDNQHYCNSCNCKL